MSVVHTPCALAPTDDLQGQWWVGRQCHLLPHVQSKSGVWGLVSGSQMSIFFTSGAALTPQTEWKGFVVFIKTPMLFLSPSIGHPVPKPELTHLLERGQQLWPVRRDLLARSTSPGTSQQLVGWGRGSRQPASRETLSSWGFWLLLCHVQGCTSADHHCLETWAPSNVSV